MEENQKVCPLLPPKPDNEPRRCLSEGCAFWNRNGCQIGVVADALDRCAISLDYIGYCVEDLCPPPSGLNPDPLLYWPG